MRPQCCMQAFRDVLNDSSLVDLGYIGDDFTWRRGRIRERLDRVVSNGLISNLFPHLAVVHEEFSKLDHRPLVLDTEYYAGPQRARASCPRRFEARWLREETVDSIVETAWARAKARPGATLAEATSDVHKSLHCWDKEVLQGPRTKLRELQKKLNEVMSGTIDDDNLDQQKALQMQIEDLLENEELYWVQRGRIDWLRYGDQNTAYFHRSASALRK